MANTYNLNQTPLTGALAFYQLIALMLAAGWTQQGSGDGATFSNAAAGPVVSGSIGTGGLNNTNAWVRLRMPVVNGVTREITIQRTSASSIWRVKYSRSGGFTGGAPSAT